jgi:hypothetical protein
MKFTKLVNTKLRLYGEAELPELEQPDASLPQQIDTASPSEVDTLKQDTDSKVSLVIKGTLDMVRDVVSVLKQTFASELNSTKGDFLDKKLQEIIDASSITDSSAATPERLNEIQRKVKELLPGGEV